MSDRRRLIAMLAAAASLGPLSMHILAPALPEIAHDFEVGPGQAQLMLSLSMIGMAVATLIVGPLADYYGRRPVLLWSIAATATASALCAFSPVLEAAIAGRILQAACAASGLVLGRAVARDRFGPEGSAEMIAQITAVMVVVPMIAPLLGGEVTGTVGWRGIFILTALAAMAVGLWLRFSLPETLREPTESVDIRSIFVSLGIVARRRGFWIYAWYATFIFAAFNFFVGAAPYVAREAWGAPPELFGRWFALVSACFIGANLTGQRLSRRLGGDVMIHIGAAVSFAGFGGGLALVTMGADGAWTLFAPMCVGAVGAGLSMPNAMAGAVSAAPERAGAASSLVGFSQFTVSALVIQGAAYVPHDSSGPSLAWMAALSAVGAIGFVILRLSKPKENLGF